MILGSQEDWTGINTTAENAESAEKSMLVEGPPVVATGSRPFHSGTGKMPVLLTFLQIIRSVVPDTLVLAAYGMFSSVSRAKG